MRQDLRISLLGVPRVRNGAGRDFDSLGPKATALLACLAVAPGMRLPRVDLVRLLWCDARSDAAARHALRQCLVRLRRQLGPAGVALGADAASVWLDPDRVETDVGHLMQVAREGSEEDVADLSRRIGGAFCDGLDLSGPEFEHWLRRHRTDIDGICAELLSRAALIFAARGEPDAAIAAARRRIALEPFEDEAHAQLIAVCAEMGRQHLARDAYAECVRIYRGELGIAPGPDIADALDRPPPSRSIRASRLPGASEQPRGAPAVVAPVAAAVGLATLIAQVFLAVAPTQTPREEPTRAALWVTAAEDEADVRTGYTRSAQEKAKVGEGGQHVEATTDIRRMLEGDRAYASLYPAGC